MNRYLYILFAFIFVFLTACNKESRTKKKLAGNWNIISYQYSNFSGLSYDYQANGQIIFENCDNDLCNYSIDMFYLNQSDTIYRTEQGFYSLIDGKEYYNLYKTDSSGITDTIENGRIILLTKKDLKIEFTEFYQRHLFILERD